MTGMKFVENKNGRIIETFDRFDNYISVHYVPKIQEFFINLKIITPELEEFKKFALYKFLSVETYMKFKEVGGEISFAYKKEYFDNIIEIFDDVIEEFNLR